MGTRTIILVRHGQYDQSKNGTPEERLTKLGRQQARSAGRYLRKLEIDSLYVSDMRRARETARLICESLDGIEPIVNRSLRECVPALPAEILSPNSDAADLLDFVLRARRSRKFRQKEQKALEEQPWVEAGAVERGAVQLERAWNHFFRPASGQDRLEVLVTHGNLIRGLLTKVLGIPPEFWLNRMLPFHCGLTTIRVRKRGLCFLQSYNELQHLPAAQRTGRNVSSS